MKLIVITPSEVLENEASHVTRMLEMGILNVHIRKPKLSTSEFRDYIQSIPEHFHDRLVIHSHHKLALAFNLKGIHITRLHKKRWFRLWLNRTLLKSRGKSFIQTGSFRKLASLYEEVPGYDYVFLSPIFDSLSGSFQGGFNEFSLTAALKKNPHKVIARGGISIDQIEKVRSIGFEGMALYSCLWKKKDPVGELAAILSKCKNLSIEIS